MAAHRAGANAEDGTGSNAYSALRQVRQQTRALEKMFQNHSDSKRRLKMDRPILTVRAGMFLQDKLEKLRKYMHESRIMRSDDWVMSAKTTAKENAQ